MVPGNGSSLDHGSFPEQCPAYRAPVAQSFLTAGRDGTARRLSLNRHIHSAVKLAGLYFTPAKAAIAGPVTGISSELSHTTPLWRALGQPYFGGMTRPDGFMNAAALPEIIFK